MYTYIIAAAPLLPEIENDTGEQCARAFLALGAPYMDPIVGNLMKRFLVKVKSLLTFKLHLCLSHLGVAEYRWNFPVLNKSGMSYRIHLRHKLVLAKIRQSCTALATGSACGL